MNKEQFIKELSKKVNLSEEVCQKINDILESHFLIGKNNKMKIISDIKEKLNLNDEVCDKIYNASIELLGSGLKEKLAHPFKNLD